jgi:ferredoxin
MPDPDGDESYWHSVETDGQPPPADPNMCDLCAKVCPRCMIPVHQHTQRGMIACAWRALGRPDDTLAESELRRTNPLPGHEPSTLDGAEDPDPCYLWRHCNHRRNGRPLTGDPRRAVEVRWPDPRANLPGPEAIRLGGVGPPLRGVDLARAQLAESREEQARHPRPDTLAHPVDMTDTADYSADRALRRECIKCPRGGVTGQFPVFLADDAGRRAHLATAGHWPEAPGEAEPSGWRDPGGPGPSGPDDIQPALIDRDEPPDGEFAY